MSALMNKPNKRKMLWLLVVLLFNGGAIYRFGWGSWPLILLTAIVIFLMWFAGKDGGNGPDIAGDERLKSVPYVGMGS